MICRFFTEYFTNHGKKNESKIENQTIYAQIVIDQKSEPKWYERRPTISILSAVIQFFFFLFSVKRYIWPFYLRPNYGIDIFIFRPIFFDLFTFGLLL